MKKASWIFVACLLGTLAALQVDRVISARNDRKPVLTNWIRNDDAVSVNAGSTAADFRSAAKRILPAVVSIDAVGLQDNWFGVQQVGDSGSGVIISKDGHVVTNAHVIQAGDRLEQVTVNLSDGRSFPAKVLGSDTRSDLAVLKIEATNLTPAVLGKSSDLQVGDWVLAVGNPFRQENTVSAGIVGNLGRDVQLTQTGWLMDAIQTDASINPGNSGGALTNAVGELVGINSAILSPGRGGSVGIGFAIPIDRAKVIINDLIQSGKARYGYMGVELAARPGLLQIPAAREQYRVETGFDAPKNGVLVVRVSQGSPADDAGIKILDVILSVNGEEIQDRDDFIRLTYGLRPNEQVDMTFFSKGKTIRRTIVLSEVSNL